MGQPTAMNSVSASTADAATKQAASKQKNARNNGYRAKELAEIRNSLRPFEQGDQLGYRASLRHNNLQLPQQLLNGEQLRQLEGEQLLGDVTSQQLRAGSSLSESSTNSDSVSSVQDALNKLTLMGYDEVGFYSHPSDVIRLNISGTIFFNPLTIRHAILGFQSLEFVEHLDVRRDAKRFFQVVL
jgi:hypothetical protein